MGLFNKKSSAAAAEIEPSEKATQDGTPATTTPANGSIASAPVQTEHHDDIDAIAKSAKVPILAYVLGAIASIGGFMFGYESGQISGMYKHYHLLI
jgi:SP family sugar:H+ symporter-like MFS transporter